MPKLTVKSLLIFTACLFFLNGCGGGGGSSGASSPPVGASSPPVSIAPKGDGTALISWTAPTENTDNSTLTDLAGFKIYYGTFPGDYDKTITIDNVGLSSYLVEDLDPSDWFFVMTAFNSSGIESAYSTEVSKAIE
jgi:hypothetical protein